MGVFLKMGFRSACCCSPSALKYIGEQLRYNVLFVATEQIFHPCMFPPFIYVHVCLHLMHLSDRYYSNLNANFFRSDFIE